MNKLKFFLFAILTTSDLFADSIALTGNWLITGFQAEERVQNKREKFSDLSDYMCCMGYIGGVAMTGDQLWWHLPPHYSWGQLEAVTIKFMNSHPEQWSDPADIIIGRAFKEAFPLNKKE